MILSRSVKRKLLCVKLIVFDFDGVMTNNKVLLSETGEEYAFISRSDGVGIYLLREAGYKVLFLSSETKPIVAMRANKLHVPVIHGTKEKRNALIEYTAVNGVSLEEILYVGNEWNDVECLKIAGVAVIPNDAHSCVKKLADIKLRSRGGDGVARELADLLNSVTKRGG